MTDLWRLIDRMEQLTDHIEDINEYLDKVHETHEAFNTWINSATESIIELQKQVKYLRNKRDCI
ncbi:MAG TPA: hypothetical protein VLE21_04735 [Candidatus Nitrosocosmicus sp.]|nr:hypothetical protein [Candidatus Nitrosocosmicus sp.]